MEVYGKTSFFFARWDGGVEGNPLGKFGTPVIVYYFFWITSHGPIHKSLFKLVCDLQLSTNLLQDWIFFSPKYFQLAWIAVVFLSKCKNQMRSEWKLPRRRSKNGTVNGFAPFHVSCLHIPPGLMERKQLLSHKSVMRSSLCSKVLYAHLPIPLDSDKEHCTAKYMHMITGVNVCQTCSVAYIEIVVSASILFDT